MRTKGIPILICALFVFCVGLDALYNGQMFWFGFDMGETIFMSILFIDLNKYR